MKVCKEHQHKLKQATWDDLPECPFCLRLLAQALVDECNAYGGDVKRLDALVALEIYTEGLK